MSQSKLELYDAIIDRCPDFERKGKTMIHTSANGYMFSALNKADEIGIRFSKEVQKKYMEEFNTTHFKSYGAVMQGYILIPEAMLDDLDKLAELMNESYRYVMSLPSK